MQKKIVYLILHFISIYLFQSNIGSNLDPRELSSIVIDNA